MNITDVFEVNKLTENGDNAYNKVSLDDTLLNILFLSEYYSVHLNEVPEIGNSEREKMFARFIRDPRLGLGKRDLGRVLMKRAGCSIEDIVKSGRVDDLFIECANDVTEFPQKDVIDWLYDQINSGNELVKKWMPRYHSKNLKYARFFANCWGMTKQRYGKFIKSDTTENKLSRKRVDEIDFSKLPSLCLLKYYNRFAKGEDTKHRFEKYIEDVKSGRKEMHVATTTVYDIYKNRYKIDPDVFFDKMEKISFSALPIVDTSGSMTGWKEKDLIGKAISIGHYLAKCSSYMPGVAIPFSSKSYLIDFKHVKPINGSRYLGETSALNTGDMTNTDFAKVMELFKDVDELPEWLIVLSDMEFDRGSRNSKDEVMRLWKEKGYTTKIVWWNLSPRDTTSPEMDIHGNVFMSGYSPYLLKYLESGFDSKKFLDNLICKYSENIKK